MNDIINGKTVSFSLASPDDAEFIYKLRVNSELNKYISSVTGTISDQKEWLIAYKDKEKRKKEFYYIINRKDSAQPIGTVRLYDFIVDINSFCWGSWILNENKTPSSAIESALLVYKIGFERLKFTQSHFQVDKKNKLVVDFHIKTGAEKVGEDKTNLFFIFVSEKYDALKLRYRKFL